MNITKTTTPTTNTTTTTATSTTTTSLKDSKQAHRDLDGDDSHIELPKQDHHHKQNNDNILQVFLGGSCNPTTWRRNVAIPFLELNGISYYNPQIENWTPEVVNLERYAKQNAQVLLFVIDRQTRSTVSIVESAYMAAERKNLVLVIYPLEYNILSMSDKQTQSNVESKSKHTTRTTSTSRAISLHHQNKRTILETSSSSTATRISTTAQYNSTNNPAITSTTSSKTTTLNSSKISTSTKIEKEGCEIDESSSQQTHQEANLESKANGGIIISDELISFSEYHELKRARHILHNLIAFQKIPIFSDMLQALKYILNHLDDDKTKTIDNAIENLPNSSISTNFSATSSMESVESMKDIYLSLDSDDQAGLEATVLPILNERGLTYNYMTVNNTLSFNHDEATSVSSSHLQSVVASDKPSDSNQLLIDKEASSEQKQMSLHSHQQKLTSANPSLPTKQIMPSYDVCERTKLALEREIGAIKSSRILLFVITNKCRGLSIMVLASHFMALFRNNVVLCLQYLEEPCSIGGETLTETAIADYNRGRVYLSDYAVKSQVPVFSNIQEAVECCSRKCGYYDNKN